MENYQPPSEEELSKKKKKKKRDPNKPKKSQNAYLRFCHEHRKDVTDEYERDSEGIVPSKAQWVTSTLGFRWSQLKKSTKLSDRKLIKKYQAEADAGRKRYLEEMANYESNANSNDPEEENTTNRVPKRRKPCRVKAGLGWLGLLGWLG